MLMIKEGQLFKSKKSFGRFAIIEEVFGDTISYRATVEGIDIVYHEHCNLTTNKFLEKYNLIKDV